MFPRYLQPKGINILVATCRLSFYYCIMKTYLLSITILILSLQPLLAQVTKPVLDCTREPNPVTISQQKLLRQASDTTRANKVAVYYVLPRDASYSQEEYDAIRKATREIQAWFQINTGGVTYTFSFPDTVVVYEALENTAHYADDWWSMLLPEMEQQGLPIWQDGTVASLWIKTGYPYGIGLGAQWCDGYCGVAMAGVENFPEFNNTGVCSGGTGVNAWPCVPHGTMAHELGHAFGLSHPAEVEETAEVADHSVMQTHWNYPYYAPEHQQPWGLLTTERTHLWENPFLYKDIKLKQIYTADVVNLPVTGPTPEARFKAVSTPHKVKLINKTKDAKLYYWTFGDGMVSNEKSPEYTYRKPGTYTVELRASNSSGMTDVSRQTVTVTGKHPHFDRPIHVGPIIVFPNPSTDGFFEIKLPPEMFPITITLMNSKGTILSKQVYKSNQDLSRIDLSKQIRGLYFIKVDVLGFSQTLKVIRN